MAYVQVNLINFKLLENIKMTSEAKRLFNREIAQCSGRLIERQQIANLLIEQREYFEYALSLFLDEHAPDTHRLSWCIDLVYQQQPLLFKGHTPKLIKALDIQTKDSALRCILKTVSHMSQTADFRKEISQYPKQIQSLIEKGFEYLTENHEVAVQVHAMELLFHWRSEEPWISKALTDIIDAQYSQKSAAFRARSKRIMKQLEKEKS